MSKRKSTFKVSSRRRPLWQRLTPLAWAMVGVTTLAVGLAATLGVMSLTSCSNGEVWQPTPTATPVPTDTPASTPGPSRTPTVWYEGMVSPTPEPGDAFPAWWSDEMAQDEEGKWWPPDDVVEMVKDHYFAAHEARQAFIYTGQLADLDSIEATLYEWYSGPRLEENLGFLAEQREGDSIYTTDWNGECLTEVQEWSADGLECTIGVACQDGTLTERNPLTGEVISETHVDHGGLILMRMRYDALTGHWMAHELVNYVPVGE